MRLTTLFSYITACAAACYIVAVCTEDEDDPIQLFENSDDDLEWVVIEAEESTTS